MAETMVKKLSEWLSPASFLGVITVFIAAFSLYWSRKQVVFNAEKEFRETLLADRSTLVEQVNLLLGRLNTCESVLLKLERRILEVESEVENAVEDSKRIRRG